MRYPSGESSLPSSSQSAISVGRLGAWKVMPGAGLRLCLRPVKEALPPRYEVAEILNLQAVRDAAQLKRTKAEG